MSNQNLILILDIDEMDPPKFIVQVKGLDDNGALASEEGDEVTIKGKLIGECSIFGIYSNMYIRKALASGQI